MTIDMSPITTESLAAVPVFPLPGTVLLPGTYISLHIFEPRYRAMMEYVIEGHRMLVVALLDEEAGADEHGRPRVHPVAGLGRLRRSVKLPDGRYNIVLEGVARVDITDELAPELVFRRARARVVESTTPEDTAGLAASMAAVHALFGRALTVAGQTDPDVMESLAEADEPGALADLVAAACLQSSAQRQSVLAEPDVGRRLETVAGALGELLLTASGDVDDSDDEAPRVGWGIQPGKA